MTKPAVTKPALVDRLSDPALLAAVAVGDEYAATVFVRRFQRQIFGLAAHMCGDSVLAEDIAQQTFERVWAHARSYDQRRGSVRTWVLTICRRLVIDSWRVGRQVPHDPSSLAALLGPSVAPSPEERAEVALEMTRVCRAVAALPIGQQRAVLLATLGGHTASEIAAIDHIPVGTAKTRLRAGLSALRSRLVAEEWSDA